MSRLITNRVDVRKLRNDDFESHCAFLLDLDPDSCRDRFFGAVSDSYIAEHARTAWESNTLVYGCFVAGELRGVAELFRSEHDRTAEAAFVVHPSFRARGVGTVLLDKVVLAARNPFYRADRVVCLSHHSAMHRLVQNAEASLLLTTDEIQGEILTPLPTLLSWWREVVLEPYQPADWLGSKKTGIAHSAPC